MSRTITPKFHDFLCVLSDVAQPVVDIAHDIEVGRATVLRLIKYAKNAGIELEVETASLKRPAPPTIYSVAVPSECRDKLTECIKIFEPNVRI